MGGFASYNMLCSRIQFYLYMQQCKNGKQVSSYRVHTAAGQSGFELQVWPWQGPVHTLFGNEDGRRACTGSQSYTEQTIILFGKKFGKLSMT